MGYTSERFVIHLHWYGLPARFIDVASEQAKGRVHTSLNKQSCSRTRNKRPDVVVRQRESYISKDESRLKNPHMSLFLTFFSCYCTSRNSDEGENMPNTFHTTQRHRPPPPYKPLQVPTCARTGSEARETTSPFSSRFILLYPPFKKEVFCLRFYDSCSRTSAATIKHPFRWQREGTTSTTTTTTTRTHRDR